MCDIKTDLHILKAKHGDAFILSVTDGPKKTVVLIDSGPKIAYKEIKPELDAIDFFDLAVVTHWDEDHCGCLGKYLNDDPGRAAKFGTFWLNCPGAMPADNNPNTNVGHCKSMKDFFESEESKGNKYDWRTVVKPNTTGKWDYVDKHGFVKIRVLSPNESATEDSVKVYEAEYPNTITCKDEDVGTLYAIPLEDLSKVDFVESKQPLNNSSISFILETPNKRYLFLGDVIETQVADYLENVMGITKDCKLAVDVIKLPHHGSCRNISERLLSLVDTRHYLISTWGAFLNFRHPDRQTLAKIIYHQQPEKRDRITIHLNYDRKSMECRHSLFLKDEEIDNKQKYNFDLDDDCQWL